MHDCMVSSNEVTSIRDLVSNCQVSLVERSQDIWTCLQDILFQFIEMGNGFPPRMINRHRKAENSPSFPKDFDDSDRVVQNQ
jgi:hypothetical protein